MAGELFDKLTDYYADDPNVTVIVDRRNTRGPGDLANHSDRGQRQVRDRRRLRVPGDHPDLTIE